MPAGTPLTSRVFLAQLIVDAPLNENVSVKHVCAGAGDLHVMWCGLIPQLCRGLMWTVGCSG